jgi:SpoVK/Ycf46/Vps4 family AAA+-type ATPase
MSYVSTHEHLRAELHRVDAILEAYDPDEHAESPVDGGSRVEADHQLPEPRELSLAVSPADRRTIAAQTTEIREHCRNTDDTRLRLRVIAETCGLSRRHLDVLMLAVTPELGTEYGTRFQQAHNHQSLARPTPMFIETLFGGSWTDRLAAGTLVSSDSPLREHDLIELQPSPVDGLGTRGRLITVPDRIVDYLKGYDSLDAELDTTLTDHAGGHSDRGLVDCRAEASLDSIAVDSEIQDRLTTLTDDAEDDHRCYWHGPATEKHRAVEAVCPTDWYLKADLRAVLAASALDWLRREAALLGRPLHLCNATAATDHPELKTTLEPVFDSLADLDTAVFVTGRESWTPTEPLPREVDSIVEFPYPSADLRREFWMAHASELPEDVDPNVLAGTFRLAHGQLRAALSTARSLAAGETLTPEDIYNGCSAQSADGLADLAERIEPDSRWDDLQLRPETERKLRLVRTHITQQSTIDSDWGFADGSSRGSGVVALFEGPSGTGKTMAAELLAGDVGMDLYRIDLSSVVSKYIGETEENLEEIFEAATNSNAILLFDEADAVFGDRTEVSDSTDRYANAEVNYLLQRIERYDGIVLLTTNYASQIDSAFQRRLDHTVSFKQPEQSTRSAIWQGIFPDDAPVGEIDYEFLSTFEFTGGEINTVGQTAAILAADEAQSEEATGEPAIEMRHLVGAIQLEFETSGRLVDPAEYEPYQHLLYDGPPTATADCDHDPAPEDSGQATQSTDRRPETVVRTFFDRLNDGDPAVHDLYHSQALVDPVSQKELRRARDVDYGIEGEIERVSEESDRVVLSFVRRRDESTTAVSAELRPDDGEWKLFDLKRGSAADRLTGRSKSGNT